VSAWGGWGAGFAPDATISDIGDGALVIVVVVVAAKEVGVELARLANQAHRMGGVGIESPLMGPGDVEVRELEVGRGVMIEALVMVVLLMLLLVGIEVVVLAHLPLKQALVKLRHVVGAEVGDIPEVIAALLMREHGELRRI
jgi:hypothetical protein